MRNKDLEIFLSIRGLESPRVEKMKEIIRWQEEVIRNWDFERVINAKIGEIIRR